MCPQVGGNWNNTTNAGVWALNLNNNRTNSNNNTGFRSDSELPRILKGNGGSKGDVFLGVCPKSECIGLSGRLILEGQPR